MANTAKSTLNRKPGWWMNGVRYEGRRPLNSYRGARRNKTKNKMNRSCKSIRNRTGETRSEFDCRRYKEKYG